jgi:hypothetical protein
MVIKRIGALAGFFFLLASQTVRADFVYTYTGNDFNNVDGSTFSKNDSITGSLTFKTALGANIDTVFLMPIAFSFSDGVATISNDTPGNQLQLIIQTNSSAAISGWNIAVFKDSPDGDFEHEIVTLSTNGVDGVDSGTDFTNNHTGSNFNPGTWSLAQIASPVPEPSTWAMMILGFAGIGVMTYRRRWSAMLDV